MNELNTSKHNFVSNLIILRIIFCQLVIAWLKSIILNANDISDYQENKQQYVQNWAQSHINNGKEKISNHCQ